MDEKFEQEIAFAFGYTKCWLEGYAERLGVSSQLVTSRVSELLFNTTGREVLGANNNVPVLRPSPAVATDRKSKVAVVKHTHRHKSRRQKVTHPDRQEAILQKLQSGESTAPELAELFGLRSTSVYPELNNLLAQGRIIKTRSEDGKHMTYSVSPSERIA